MTDAKTKVETDIVNNVKQYLQHVVLGSRQRYGGVNVCGHWRTVNGNVCKLPCLRSDVVLSKRLCRGVHIDVCCPFKLWTKKGNLKKRGSVDKWQLKKERTIVL